MNVNSIHDDQPDMCRLIEQHGSSLLRMAAVYLQDVHLAEDAVQEAFIKAYKCYHTFQGRSSEKTWLTSITINICKDYLKSAWNRHVVPTAPTEIPETAVDSGLTQSTDYEELVDAVGQLPDKFKEVILLFYYQDMSIQEISDALQILPTTTRVRLTRARAKLKEYFNERSLPHETGTPERSY